MREILHIIERGKDMSPRNKQLILNIILVLGVVLMSTGYILAIRLLLEAESIPAEVSVTSPIWLALIYIWATRKPAKCLSYFER